MESYVIVMKDIAFSAHMPHHKPYCERKIMEHNNLSPIFEELDNITLTLAGKVRLSCFSDGAIMYADMQIAGRTLKGNPFGYFFSICKQYAAEHFEDIDYRHVNELVAQYSIQDGDTLCDKHIAKQGIPHKSNTWDPSTLNVERDRKGIKNSLKQLTPSQQRIQNKMILDLKEKGILEDEDIILYNKRQDALLHPERYPDFDPYADEHNDKKPVARPQEAQAAVRSIFDI